MLKIYYNNCTINNILSDRNFSILPLFLIVLIDSKNEYEYIHTKVNLKQQ